MTKEIKIGLSVIFSLLVVFGVVLVYKLRAPTEEPSVAMEPESGESEDEKPILASGPGGPTVLAANDKPEQAPRNDLRSGDKAPLRSLDRYPPYGATTKAPSADNGDQHKPSFLPKAPPETGKAGDEGATSDDRYTAKERYPRERLTAEENTAGEDPSHVATAGNQQPAEVAADGRDANETGANEDPFARRSAQVPEAEPPTARTRLLPVDNVQLTPNPHASSADGHAAGQRTTRDAKAGKLSTTASAGDPPPFEGDGGERGGASGADPFEKRSTGTSAADMYGENSKRNDDKYGRTANGATGSPHVVDEPPGVGMPYRRDRVADSPDSRMQPRDLTSLPDANASERSFHQGETYTVEPNDSYWTISEKVYGTGGYFKAIQKHNQPKTGRTAGLNVGQSLSVPAVEVLAQKYPELCPKPRGRPTDRGQMMTAAAGARDRLTSGGRVYIVEKGDNLFDIAKYELGKPSRWKEIYDLNSDQLGQDYDHLSPGTKLILPDGGQSETITSKPQNPYQR